MSYTSDPASFPAPVDLSHHLSRSTRAREASRVKRFYKYFSIPGISQLAGGKHDSLVPHGVKDVLAYTLQACPTTSISHTTLSKPKCVP